MRSTAKSGYRPSRGARGPRGCEDVTASEGVSALRAARPSGAPALRARSCPPSGLVACASVLALVGMSWMVWIFSQPSASSMVRHGPHGAAMWVVTSLLAVPVVLGGVWIAAQLNRFARDVIGATWNLSLTRPVGLSGHTAVGLGPGCHRLITFAGADPPEPGPTTASSTSHHQHPTHPTSASRSRRAASVSPGAFEPSLGATRGTPRGTFSAATAGALGSSEPRVSTLAVRTRRSTVLDRVAGSSSACPRPLAGRHVRAAASAHPRTSKKRRRHSTQAPSAVALAGWKSADAPWRPNQPVSPASWTPREGGVARLPWRPSLGLHVPALGPRHTCCGNRAGVRCSSAAEVDEVVPALVGFGPHVAVFPGRPVVVPGRPGRRVATDSGSR